MNKKDILIVAVKLFVITAVAALCLAFVNKITAPVIENNKIITMQQTQKEVLEAATEFEKVDMKHIDSEENGTYIEDAYRGLSKEGEVVGFVVSAVSSRGYGGDIKVMVGITSDMTINRVKITESSETAGLGLKASNPEFIDQYIGRDSSLVVKKNISPTDKGEDIAAISGATVTSKAVTNAVNLSLDFAKNIKDKKEGK